MSDGESFVIRNFGGICVQNQSDADGTLVLLFPYDVDDENLRIFDIGKLRGSPMTISELTLLFYT